ncbi:MAG: hypothetical protein OSW77_04425 [Proteobacteria bacterium]|nr:hypothetical protein [Pseudomonadota bacterium]
MRFPIRIELHRPLPLILLLALAHLLALGCLALLPWPPAFGFLAACPVLVSAWMRLRQSRAWENTTGSPAALELLADGKIRCFFGGEGRAEGRIAEIRSDTVALAMLVVLRLEFDADAAGRRRVLSLALLPGSAPREDLRRLRVFLRARGGQGA